MANGFMYIYLGKCSDYFAVFGVALAVIYALQFIRTVFGGFMVHFLAKPLGLTTNVSKLGKWAVVTGSTDGIGKAYALELAKQGLNIVLVSRSPEKLNDVALEIESLHKVKTRAIPVDFGDGPEIYSKLKHELVALEIGVLVNNVGMGLNYPEYFLDIENSSEVCQKMMSVNMTSMVQMTHLCLPAMIQRRRGAIINVSSGTALGPSPLFGVYAPTKTFADYFSRGLQLEYKDKGVLIQSVLPFFVATKMSKIKKDSWFVPSPKTYVKAALQTLGLQHRTFGCLSHGIQAYLVLCFPSSLMEKLQISVFLNTRAKALKKVRAEKND